MAIYKLQNLIFVLLFFCMSLNSTFGQQSYDDIVSGYRSASVSTHGAPPMPAPENGQAKQIKGPKKPPKRGPVTFDIYRDRQPFPIDPRKPCHYCIQRKGTNHKFAKMHNRIFGFQGRPFQEKEPGGCLCGKKKQNIKRPNINVYWPTWFAGVTEELFPVKSALSAANYDRFRIVDIYDHLGGFEVSGYQRKDNGYCGPGRDRYGCLGESKYLESNVFGVGLRPPGQPIERGGVAFP